MCTKPPPYCPNSDHSRNIISSPRLARQAASSCTLYSTEILIKKKCSHLWLISRAMGVSVPRPLEGGPNPTVGKETFDHQYQAVASSIIPSMEKNPLMSWTWAQPSSNQRTSIAILIKGKKRINVNIEPIRNP
jgi:hypothetical protein